MHLDWTDSFFLFSSASVLATSLCRTDQARLESKKKVSAARWTWGGREFSGLGWARLMMRARKSGSDVAWVVFSNCNFISILDVTYHFLSFFRANSPRLNTTDEKIGRNDRFNIG
jgi:hypothetical protein